MLKLLKKIFETKKVDDYFYIDDYFIYIEKIKYPLINMKREYVLFEPNSNCFYFRVFDLHTNKFEDITIYFEEKYIEHFFDLYVALINRL